MRDRHVVLERVWRRTAIVVDGPLRERLEVKHAGVAPPARFLFLDGEERARLLEALLVDERGKPLPRVLHATHTLEATAISCRQLVPQRASRWHPVVPRDVMEPEKVRLGYAVEPAEDAPNRWRVLAHGVAARCRAIEADPSGVGAVVVHRVPVGARATADPGTRTVVMAARHQVMQDERRHVVHRQLSR